MSPEKKAKRCPQCGVFLEELQFIDEPNICYSCGWGVVKVDDDRDVISPLQLNLYWFITMLLLTGSLYLVIHAPDWALGAALAIVHIDTWLEFFMIYLVFWWGYSSLSGIFDFRVDLDEIGSAAGIFFDPLSILMLVLAIVFFPGRIIFTTFVDSWKYLFPKKRRKRKSIVP